MAAAGQERAGGLPTQASARLGSLDSRFGARAFRNRGPEGENPRRPRGKGETEAREKHRRARNSVALGGLFQAEYGPPTDKSASERARRLESRVVNF